MTLMWGNQGTIFKEAFILEEEPFRVPTENLGVYHGFSSLAGSELWFSLVLTYLSQSS